MVKKPQHICPAMVPCPICGAGPNELCIGSLGRFHSARWKVRKEEQQKLDSEVFTGSLFKPDSKIRAISH